MGQIFKPFIGQFLDPEQRSPMKIVSRSLPLFR